MDAREQIAQMMIRLGIATGHGDTLDDLIGELEIAIIELQSAVPKERARILAYLDHHEYDISSGSLDALSALRRELQRSSAERL